MGVESALRDVARARSSCLMAFCPVINMIDLLFKIMAYNTDIVFSLSFTGKCPLFLFLRTFARKFSNIDFFLKILPLKDDELVMSEM